MTYDKDKILRMGLEEFRGAFYKQQVIIKYQDPSAGTMKETQGIVEGIQETTPIPFHHAPQEVVGIVLNNGQSIPIQNLVSILVIKK